MSCKGPTSPGGPFSPSIPAIFNCSNCSTGQLHSLPATYQQLLCHPWVHDFLQHLSVQLRPCLLWALWRQQDLDLWPHRPTWQRPIWRTGCSSGCGCGHRFPCLKSPDPLELPGLGVKKPAVQLIKQLQWLQRQHGQAGLIMLFRHSVPSSRSSDKGTFQQKKMLAT